MYRLGAREKETLLYIDILHTYIVTYSATVFVLLNCATHRTLLRVKEKKRKNEEAQLSIDPKRGKTIDLYTKEREGKLHADCQSRSPQPSTSAEPSSSAWGQARPMGAASHRPHARVHRHRRLRKPPGQIPSQHTWWPLMPYHLWRTSYMMTSVSHIMIRHWLVDQKYCSNSKKCPITNISSFYVPFRQTCQIRPSHTKILVSRPPRPNHHDRYSNNDRLGLSLSHRCYRHSTQRLGTCKFWELARQRE